MGSMTGWSGMDAMSGLVGGGNPLAFSGLVGYWSADYGVYQDGACQFTASHSDYLSVASNATLQTGVDFWLATWVYFDGTGTQDIITKYTGTNSTSEFRFYYTAARFQWQVCYGASSITTTANTFGAASASTWYFVFAYWDAANNLAKISINGGAFDSASTGAAVNTTSAPLNFSGYNSGSGTFYGGRLDSVGFGKSPVGGIAALATTIRDALYNSGVGKLYADLTSAQKTDWGLVSWWDLGEETGIRYDSHGSNHLNENFTAARIDATTLNGGFETAGGGGADVFGSWTETASGTTTITLDTTNQRTGAACAAIAHDGSGSSGILSQTVMAVGRRYYVSVYAKADSTSGTPVYRVGSNFTELTMTLTTSYVQYSTVFTARETSFMLIRNSGVASRTVYLDDVELKPVDVQGTSGIPAGLAVDANFAAQLNGPSQYMQDPGTGGNYDVNNENAVITVWCYLDYKTAGATPHVISKYQNGFNRNYRIWYDVTANRFNWGVYDTGTAASQEVAANTLGAVSIGTWYLVTVYHDATLHEIGISVNGGAFDTAAVAFNPSPGGGNFVVGQDLLLLNGWPGRVDAIGFAKPASGCAAQAADMRTSVFNSGIGKKYASLTSTEKTNWGLVHWWDNEEASGSHVNQQTSGQDLVNTGSITRLGGVNYIMGLASKWLDQSTSGLNWVQTTATKRPAYQTTAFGNSKPALWFDGVDDFMSVASAGALSTQDRTIFVVLNVVGGSAIRLLHSSGATRLYMGVSATEQNLVSWDNSTPAQKTFAAASGVGSKVHAARWLVTGGNPTVDLWVNATQSTQANADGVTTPTLTTYYLGSLSGSANFYDSYVSAIAVYNVALDNGSVANIINFLRGKFGI